MRLFDRRMRRPAGRRLVSPGAGGGVSFTPDSVADLTLWLDPTQGLYQERTGASATTPAASDGDPVGTWRAQTGQYFTAPADGQRPLLRLVSGAPYLEFDGTDDVLLGSVSATQPFWAFTGLNPTSLGATRRAFDSTDRALFGYDGTGYQLYAGTTVLASGTASTGNQVLAVEFNGASSALRRDGGAAVVSGNPGASGTAGTVYIGAGDVTGATGLVGQVRDVLLYGRDLSSAEADQVGTYLAGRIGTTWNTIA